VEYWRSSMDVHVTMVSVVIGGVGRRGFIIASLLYIKLEWGGSSAIRDLGHLKNGMHVCLQIAGIRVDR